MAENFFICSDGHKLAYNLWLPSPNTEIKAFLQILHGMAEYSDRYAKFAEYLNKLGIAVFAADHRGHGASATTRYCRTMPTTTAMTVATVA